MRLGVIWAHVRAWWWLLALGVVVLALFFRRRQGPSSLLIAVSRRLDRAEERARRQAEAIVEERLVEEGRQGEDWQAVKAAGDAAVGPDEPEPQSAGPKRHNLDFLLVISTVLITCCSPALVPAQTTIEPNPRAMTVAQAFDPAPATFSVAVREARPACAAGEGWWPAEGACVLCPPLAHYQPAGDIPEGCPAPIAGTLVELEIFERLKARAKGAVRLEAEGVEFRRRLTDAHGRIRSCLKQRQADAQRQADEMSLCADAFEAVAQPPGFPWSTAITSGAVGALVGGLLFALL